MFSRFITCSVAAVLASSMAMPAHAQVRNELQQIVHTLSGSPNPDHFGAAIDIDGNTAVIGAYFANPNSLGEAYVYVKNGTSWTLQATLVPSGGQPGTFGTSVAISGDTIVVGSPLGGGATAPGNAYVFVRSGTTWTQQAILNAGGFTQSSGYFGGDVAIDGNRILVGAPFHTVSTAAQAGMCFAFTRTGTTWSAPAQIISSNFQSGARFGGAIALQGTRAVIGAAFQNAWAGAAYDFALVGSTWTQQQQLLPTSGATSRFGYCVEMNGSDLAVGAPFDDALGTDSGALYVFTTTGGAWSQQAKLSRTGAASSDLFGVSVGLATDELVVSMSPLLGAAPVGSAFRFCRSATSWFQSHTLVPATNQGGSGYSVVAMSGDDVIIGAPNFDSGVFTDLGTAYAFALAGFPYGYCVTGAPCGNNFTTGGCINNLTSGLGARLMGAGSASIASNDFGFDTTQLPVSTLCIATMSPFATAPVQNANGLLVLGSPLFRLGNQNSVNGTLTLPNILSDPLMVASGQVFAGNTVRFQIWYRNPGPGCSPLNTNWSNGYELTLVP